MLTDVDIVAPMIFFGGLSNFFLRGPNFFSYFFGGGPKLLFKFFQRIGP